MQGIICPLCQSPNTVLFHSDDVVQEGVPVHRDFWRCGECDLTFLQPDQRLAPVEEKLRYDTHNNDPSDAGYVKFLNQLWQEMEPSLAKGSQGLDFGCGPTRPWQEILQPKGYQMTSFDPYFLPETSALSKTYDFIVSTEVLEHLYRPGEVLAQLKSLLKPGGVLGVMTRLMPRDEDFPKWYYHNDPTHVVFYSEKTLRWVANRFAWQVKITPPQVAVFRCLP